MICMLLLICVAINKPLYAQTPPTCDQICGKWMTTTKNLIVQVYKDGEDFKAKIVWFDDSDDKSHPVDSRLDTQNPDKTLRDHRIVGTNILDKLTYVPHSNSWENGIIYDAIHGRYWDSSVYITPDGQLKVTGYWHFKFIGRTLTFTRL